MSNPEVKISPFDLFFVPVSYYPFRRKSQQAEREYEKVKHQLENLEESVRDRCKKEFTGTISAAALKPGIVANAPQRIHVSNKL